MPSPEDSIQIYQVKDVVGLEPDVPIEGYLACASNIVPQNLLNAVDDLGEKAEEGVICVLSGELLYADSSVLTSITQAGVEIKGLLTFGGTLNSRHRGVSHIDVLARELGIPFCLAERPRKYRRQKQELNWINKWGSTEIHGELGRMTLIDQSQRVELETR